MRPDKTACMDKIRKCGVVPVATIDDSGKAADLARAMLRGGIDVIEVTFRTAAAADAIRAISESCPDMLVGAGTVLTMEQCRRALDCGAAFIVSPGFDPEIVGWCVENGYGTEQSYERAMNLYQKAADLGDANAMFRIGVL